jgi:queuine tRNA-ribosyltransferase
MREPSFGFTVSGRDGRARAGVLRTAHGEIRTPVFMPVGTAASVKALTGAQLEEIGAEIILGNTYHLMLRPGAERIARLGGLHEFMRWNRPILTDSGGFQVMSLSGVVKITEEGALFSSHLDGSRHMLTPERSMEIQRLLGSTITMIFDECLRHPATEEETARSTELSLRWAERSARAYRARNGYALFGIVQGGMVPALRRKSAEALRGIGFDGYAVGGLAVGEEQSVMFSMLEETVPALPEDKPRYLMGVGKPLDMIGAVKRGIDMFDCVLPTRSGRNGQAFTRDGPLNIRNSRFAEDTAPLDAECGCFACMRHSRAYLHHLIRAKEITGAVLMTLHNVRFYLDLMRDMRAAIPAGGLDAFAERFGRRYAGERD